MLVIYAAAVAIGLVIGAIYFLAKSKEQRPTVQKAIEELRSTEGMLDNKRQWLREEVDLADKTTRTNVRRDERAALVALKKKKHLENELHQIDVLSLKIGSQKQDLETANTYSVLVEKMSYASKALQVFHQEFDVQGVYDLMKNTEEQRELLKNIYWVIADQLADFGMNYQYDEDELMDQIEELKQEELDRQLLQIGELPVC